MHTYTYTHEMTHKLMLKLFGPIRIYRFSGKSKEKEEMKFSAKKRKKMRNPN